MHQVRCCVEGRACEGNLARSSQPLDLPFWSSLRVLSTSMPPQNGSLTMLGDLAWSMTQTALKSNTPFRSIVRDGSHADLMMPLEAADCRQDSAEPGHRGLGRDLHWLCRRRRLHDHAACTAYGCLSRQCGRIYHQDIRYAPASRIPGENVIGLCLYACQNVSC